MGKNSYRKPRPSQPNWFWLNIDGCYFCKTRKRCNGCRVLKEAAAEQRKKRDRRTKAKLKEMEGGNA